MWLAFRIWGVGHFKALHFQVTVIFIYNSVYKNLLIKTKNAIKKQAIKTPLALRSCFFFKKIKNRVDYIDGANLIANEAIERVVLNGQARAYGLEVLFRKVMFYEQW